MKKCPVCQAKLNRILLEQNLPAFSCTSCEGIWISSNEYLSWLAPQGPTTEINDISEDNPLPVVDNRQALLCPDCGRFLRRFKIWPDIEFQLDRCGGCNGIWFDRNEWQTLKIKNMHHNISLFFTDEWQEKLRNEEMKRRFVKMYQEKFGPDYQKIKEIRAWLSEHPQGGQLLAYLTDKDPYRG
jgi:Zn-finger nucleic acid-binding protein